MAWFSWPRVPLGHITLLGARGGAGKGLVAASLAASATGGQTAFGNCSSPPPGRVLWIEEEDPEDVVLKPRLRAAHARLDMVAWDRAKWFRTASVGALRSWITQHNIRLLVFSPLLQALGVHKMNDGVEVFNKMSTLQAVVDKLPVAAIGIVHTNKNADMAAIERVLGSVTFSNFARSVLLISTRNGEKRLVHAKCNVGPEADDLILSLHGEPRSQAWAVQWSVPLDGNSDREGAFDRGSAEGGGSLGAWLRAFLEEVGGVEQASVCMQAGELHGYNSGSLKAIRKAAGVESAKSLGAGGPWWWRLSGRAWPWETSESH